MNNLDEVFTSPLANNYGVYKTLSGDITEDYPKIIADMMEMMFRNHMSCQFEQRYAIKLQDDDFVNYRSIAFDGRKIRREFESRLVQHLKDKHFRIIRVTVPDSKHRYASYYELTDDYDKFVIGVGAYKHPVWLLNDE